jgi:hypothetical protein
MQEVDNSHHRIGQRLWLHGRKLGNGVENKSGYAAAQIIAAASLLRI